MGREARRPAFVEVALPVPVVEGPIAIVLAGGARIEVSGSFDPDVLRKILLRGGLVDGKADRLLDGHQGRGGRVTGA